MKNLMLLSAILLGASFAQASACKVYSDENHGNELLGNVVMMSGEGEYSEGYLNVESYNMASKEYTKKTAAYQIRITQDNKKSPYKIELWLLSNNRVAEAKVQMTLRQLPLEVSFDLAKNVNSYPDVQESASAVILKCEEN